MNYRHAYHAGNFADAFKHIILVALSQAFLHKDSAFCFLDTHAGIGYYDLFSPAAQKSKEFETGITRILAHPKPPTLIKTYLDCVQAVNFAQTDTLEYYPGSPSIVRQFLRPQDRMVLSELHEEDCELLRKAFSRDKQVGIHHQDAYQALKAFLPPKERRGFVLIDPPYEKPNELTEVTNALAQAIQRWETGVYALWYPIKQLRLIERFHLAVKDKIKRPMLSVELSIYPEDLDTHLNGSGILIVNPPWKLDQAIKEVLPWLWHALSPNQQGRYEMKTL